MLHLLLQRALLLAAIAILTLMSAEQLHASSLPYEVSPTAPADWKAEEGDTLVVDTKENIGYLVHQDGMYTSFPVVTGQRRVVRYIGRTYNAATPAREWRMMSEEKKGDKITFGEKGAFLRLSTSYDGGMTEEKTPYGVHTHRSIAEMIAEDDRYRSMGCILVTEEILQLIRESYLASGGSLRVVTRAGLPEDQWTLQVLQEIVMGNADKEM